MGASGQDKLTESSGSLNDVCIKRVFETVECEEVREFRILGAEIRKAREPNERLCPGSWN